jgi:hypothetical protein
MAPVVFVVAGEVLTVCHCWTVYDFSPKNASRSQSFQAIQLVGLNDDRCYDHVVQNHQSYKNSFYIYNC